MGPLGAVVGIDNSSDAIEIARRDNAERANLKFELASVYELPFGDATFDAAYGHQVLQHLTDPVAALLEVHRVVKPGGIVAMRDADYATMSHFPPTPAIDNWLMLYHDVARANGGEPDAGRRLAAWVLEAGFVDPIVTSSTWTFATPDARRAWADLWADRTTLSRFADRALELGLCDRTQLEEIAAGWRSWADEPDGWFAFIHGEILATRPPN